MEYQGRFVGLGTMVLRFVLRRRDVADRLNQALTIEVVPFVETEVVPASEQVSRVDSRTSRATSSPLGKELSLSKRSPRSRP